MSKNSTKSSSTNNGTASSTPNNLPAVQQGWGAASGLLSGTQSGVPLVNAGMDLTGAGANAASQAAISGMGTATGLANGGAVNPANKYLTPFADGSMTNSTNPYFTNMVSQMANALQPSIDGSMAGAGRYGSGANANAFASALTNQTGQLAYSNYNDALNRQTAAADQLSTNGSNSTSAALAALGLIPGLGTSAANAGASDIAAGNAPTSTYANTIANLGTGGSKSTSSGSSTGKQSTSGFNLADLINSLTGGK